MKHTLSIIFPLMALLLTACSTDDDTLETRTVTLDIPIEIYRANSDNAFRGNAAANRAAEQGDPGNDVVFEAPLYLYVYAFVSETGNTSEVLTHSFTYTDDQTATEWEIRDADTKDERWHKNVRVTFRISSDFNNAVGESRVYAIASRTDLSALLPSVAGYTTMDNMESMELDFSTFTSSQLRDIYSTPANDRSTPAASSDNGVIMSNNDVLTCSAVKLYHTAAKVDFTWEIPSSLRPTVELRKIECTGLPSTCKIFEPTDNPAGTASSVVLGETADTPSFTVDEGNKWTGRAYAYMLQPPSPGTVGYTVTYGGSGSRPQTNGTVTPAADTYSNIYTGWYRVIASVVE